jgi:hypothetical protein
VLKFSEFSFRTRYGGYFASWEKLPKCPLAVESVWEMGSAIEGCNPCFLTIYKVPSQSIGVLVKRIGI